MKKNNTKYDKTIVIPVEKYMWQSLRQISYEDEISISQLVRDALEKIINKHKKSIAL